MPMPIGTMPPAASCRRPSATSSIRTASGPASPPASLQVVATDHCAFTTEQKRFGLGDFTKIPNGTGGLEDRMPMLWTHGVNTGRLTMNEFVAVTSTNIAKILNVYPKKGAILVGADADIVVWDPKRSKTIAAKTQQSAIDYNVFEGKQVTGLPRYTLTRGVVAIEESTVKTQQGHGEFVKREAFHCRQPRALDLERRHGAAQGSAQRHPGQRGVTLGNSVPVHRLTTAHTAPDPATGQHFPVRSDRCGR